MRLIGLEDCVYARLLLLRLPPRELKAVLLRYWCGCTYAEIGEQLGVCNARVQQILERALRRLKNQVGGDYPRFGRQRRPQRKQEYYIDIQGGAS